jgi:hypothetical protein
MLHARSMLSSACQQCHMHQAVRQELRKEMRVDSHVSAHGQAEMVQKEQQIQALKAKAKSRSTLMPLLVNGVVQCERKVSEEVSQRLQRHMLPLKHAWQRFPVLAQKSDEHEMDVMSTLLKGTRLTHQGHAMC